MIVTPYSSFVPHFSTLPYDLLEKQVVTASDGDIIIEVGAFLGHGTCFLTECLEKHNKKLKLYANDLWDEPEIFCRGAHRNELMPWGETIESWRARGGRLYDSFLFYLENSPTKKWLYDHVQLPPTEIMNEFEDNSISTVFLGFSDREEDIQKEREKWMGKIRPGGTLIMAATEFREAVAEIKQ